MADAPYRDDSLPPLRAGVRPERAATVLLGRLSAGRLASPAAGAAAGVAGVGRQARHRLRMPKLWHATAGRAALFGVPGLLPSHWTRWAVSTLR
jgi:hypothetical protein